MDEQHPPIPLNPFRKTLKEEAGHISDGRVGELGENGEE